MRCIAMLTGVVLMVGGVQTATAAPCHPEGRWDVAWRARGRALGLRSLTQPLTLVVPEAGAPWVEDAFDEMTPATLEPTVVVDRKRCTATVTLRAEIQWADDAGTRLEELRLVVELRGDGGATRGWVAVDEVGPEPLHRRARVTGRAHRLVAAD